MIKAPLRCEKPKFQWFQCFAYLPFLHAIQKFCQYFSVMALIKPKRIVLANLSHFQNLFIFLELFHPGAKASRDR